MHKTRLHNKNKKGQCLGFIIITEFKRDFYRGMMWDIFKSI